MTTIKEHCCGADLLFDVKTANKQYKKYLKKGPSKVTQSVISQLKQLQPKGILIDVGGGIGAIQWWFHENKSNETYHIDASSGYLSLAKNHAGKIEVLEKSHFIMGDFTDYKDLPKADVITLDKVICCYPDFKGILNHAFKYSKNIISITYPMDGVLAQVFREFGVLFMKLSKNPFKPYVHKVSEVRDLFNSNGFELKEKNLSFPWHIETYKRTDK